MTPRTLALIAVLLLVGGAALGLRAFNRDDASSGVTDGPAQPQGKDNPYSAIRQPEHPRVSDAAGILAPFNARLGRDADALYDDLGIDIHIVTSTDTSQTIEAQSVQVMQQRKIGADAPTGGLLILLNPKLASARIEVGYSLEQALTDLHMGRIARDQLAPYTSYGAAGMAVMDVLHYLRDHVYLSAALGNLTLSEDFRQKPAYLEYQRFVSGGAGAKTALSAVPMDADLKSPVPTSKRALYAPSANAEESVAAFLRATAELAGDPTLELFTEGSRLMRKYYPFARFEELQRLERIQSAQPLEILRHDEYAVATSKRAPKGFVPILLHREQGLWRVDLVETWKNLFFNGEGNYYLRNSNTPYAFGLAQFGEGRYQDIAALPLGKESLTEALAALDGKTDTLSTLRRAELWLRNAFVFPQAYSAYEAARRLSPEDPLVLETLGERALYLGFPEITIAMPERIGRGAELTLAEAHNDTGDAKAAERWVDRALDENPYDLYALQWKQFLARQEHREDEAEHLNETMAKLMQNPSRKAGPVELFFNPSVPKYDPLTTVDVNGTQVYDHSNFRVTMRNASRREVEIESVTLASAGTAGPSGLGDVKGYWTYPSGKNRLQAGEYISFDKLWGFVVDTGHQHVRYVFRTCWHGVGTTVRQCRTQWVDAMP
ncbi:MAG: TPM domain-containing protein [Gammaproteobacteria bacterium]